MFMSLKYLLEGLKAYFQEKGQPVKKRWVCKYNKDTCDFCKRLHGQTVKWGDVFRQDGYEMVGPPAHKGCNCKIERVK